MRYGLIFCMMWMTLAPVCAQPAEPDPPEDPPEAPIKPEPPANPILHDQYYSIALNGQKCGYARIRMMVIGGKSVRTSSKQIITLRRGKIRLRMKVIEWFQESLTGRAEKFGLTMKMGRIPTSRFGRIKNNKLHLTTQQAGQTTTTVLPWSGKALFPYQLEKLMLKNGLKPGTKFSLPVFTPSLNIQEPIEVLFEVKGPEEITYQGKKVRAIRTEQTIPALGGLKEIAWLRETKKPLRSANLLRMEANFMGMKMTMTACPRRQATMVGSGAEIMMQTLARVKTPIANPRKTTFGRYRLRLKKSEANPDGLKLPKTAMQQVKSEKDAVVVTVTRGPKATERAHQPGPEYTASGLYMNLDDPRVKAMANEAIKDATASSAAAKAETLCRYVYQNIKQKTLGVGFGSASEVARSRAGDCSEHAVLLAALLRANGIPSRLAFGVLYTEKFMDRKNVFVYHMWTQAWTGGGWMDLDPAFGQVKPDATHICLFVSPLREADLLDIGVRFLLIINRLHIEVLETK